MYNLNRETLGGNLIILPAVKSDRDKSSTDPCDTRSTLCARAFSGDFAPTVTLRLASVPNLAKSLNLDSKPLLHCHQLVVLWSSLWGS